MGELRTHVKEAVYTYKQALVQYTSKRMREESREGDKYKRKRRKEAQKGLLSGYLFSIFS